MIYFTHVRTLSAIMECHFAQELNGQVSIKEMFGYAKPSQGEIQSTIESPLKINIEIIRSFLIDNRLFIPVSCFLGT